MTAESLTSGHPHAGPETLLTKDAVIKLSSGLSINSFIIFLKKNQLIWLN